MEQKSNQEVQEVKEVKEKKVVEYTSIEEANTLVTVSSAVRGLDIVPDLIKKVETMPLHQLATAYRAFKPFENMIGTAIKAMAVELRETRLENPDRVDEKGSKYIDFPDDGFSLKAECRRGSLVFKAEEAEKILKEKGLYEDATDIAHVVTDFNKLREVFEVVFNKLPKKVRDDIKEEYKLNELIQEVSSINEEKIQGLAMLKKLTPEDIDKMYDEPAPTYALKIVEKK